MSELREILESCDVGRGQWEPALEAAEAEVARLRKAISEYLTDVTAGGDPIGPQWYIDCNERTKGKGNRLGNYPGKARLARALAKQEQR